MDNTINNSIGKLSSDLSIENKKPVKSKEMGQDAFLKLMIAQLKNQDPGNPADSQNFLQQIASFNTVSGITGLQKSFDSLATSMQSSLQSSQALQASTLVGRTVITDSDELQLKNGKAQGISVNLSEPISSFDVEIENAAGKVVRKLTVDFKNPEAGRHDVQWDGTDEKRKALPDGVYKIKAHSKIQGKDMDHDTFVHAQVSSVTLPRDGSGPLLNVAGIGAIGLDKVKEVL